MIDRCLISIKEQRFKSSLLEVISNAKQSIYIVCFEVSSNEIINQLINKCQQGVEVSIVCEERKSSEKLKVLKNNVNLNILMSKPNMVWNALHQKIIIIDRKTLIFGTFNLSDRSLNNDIELYFESTDKKLLKQAVTNYQFVTKILTDDLNQSHVHQNDSSTITTEKYEGLVFSNNYKMFDILQKYILGAKKSITIFASHQISSEVIRLLEKIDTDKVKIRIYVDISVLKEVQLNHRLVRKIRFIKTDGKMHIKAILIDENQYLIGSLNLFNRSLNEDQEFLFIGNNSYFFKHLNKVLLQVSELSETIKLKTCINILLMRMKKLFKKIKRGFS